MFIYHFYGWTKKADPSVARYNRTKKSYWAGVGRITGCKIDFFCSNGFVRAGSDVVYKRSEIHNRLWPKLKYLTVILNFF